MGPLGSSGGFFFFFFFFYFVCIWTQEPHSRYSFPIRWVLKASLFLGSATEHLSQEGGLDCIVWLGSCLLNHSCLSSKSSPIASS